MTNYISKLCLCYAKFFLNNYKVHRIKVKKDRKALKVTLTL